LWKGIVIYEWLVSERRLVFVVATYRGAVRVKAGRSERVDVVAARASGLKVLAMEAMVRLYSREGGVLETKLHAQYKRQKEGGLVSPASAEARG
jgi:hypothetical protein